MKRPSVVDIKKAHRTYAKKIKNLIDKDESPFEEEIASDLAFHFPIIDKKEINRKQSERASFTVDSIKEIATIKMNDLNTDNMEKAILIIKGTAKSMGIKVEN